VCVVSQVVYQREEGGEQQEVTMGEGETLEILAAGTHHVSPRDPTEQRPDAEALLPAPSLCVDVLQARTTTGPWMAP
jgi:hypothetical protein